MNIVRLFVQTIKAMEGDSLTERGTHNREEIYCVRFCLKKFSFSIHLMNRLSFKRY